MKKLFAFLFLLAAPALAQQSNFASFNIEYDVDSDTATYCVVTGKNGSPFGEPIEGSSPIETSGSSATVTENVSGTLPFALLGTGDVLFVRRPDGTTDRRVIIAKAAGDSITVNAVVDWSGGFSFTWLKTTCGTGLTSGWIEVSGAASSSITIQYDQGDLTQFDARIECKTSSPAAAPVQIFPACDAGSCNTFQDYATVGIASRTTYVVVDPSYSSCRVAVKWTTADTSDAGANLESVTVSLTKSNLK